MIRFFYNTYNRVMFLFNYLNPSNKGVPCEVCKMCVKYSQNAIASEDMCYSSSSSRIQEVSSKRYDGVLETRSPSHPVRIPTHLTLHFPRGPFAFCLRCQLFFLTVLALPSSISNSPRTLNTSSNWGGSRIFFFIFFGGGGGGERKDYVRASTSQARNPKSLIYGRGPGKLSGFFYALLCYLNIIFKHSDTNWDKKS